MRNFAVFIPSHGRPFKQKTVDMLINGGYKGDWFIVCDNLDESLNDYMDLYGDRVIVFDKRDYVEVIDTVDNFKKLNTPVYARNFIYEKAKKMGYTYFAMMDDDVTRLKFRFEKDGRLDFQHVKDYPKLFEAVIQFQEKADIHTISFGMSFDFIGGLNSNYAKGFTRTGYCIFFCRTDKSHHFIGTLGQDLNHSWMTQQTGEIILSLTSVHVDTDPITETDGGMRDLYKSYEDSLKYMQTMYALIPRPDSVYMSYTKKGLIRRKNLQTMYPMIIKEKWKK